MRRCPLRIVCRLNSRILSHGRFDGILVQLDRIDDRTRYIDDVVVIPILKMPNQDEYGLTILYCLNVPGREGPIAMNAEPISTSTSRKDSMFWDNRTTAWEMWHSNPSCTNSLRDIECDVSNLKASIPRILDVYLSARCFQGQ